MTQATVVNQDAQRPGQLAPAEGAEQTGQAGQNEGIQCLTFSVANERFAVDILDIREIIEVGMMTSVPLAPDFVRGVVNLRGNVLPVIDLAVRLGRERQDIGKRTCIVVVEIRVAREDLSLGILVDEVNEILEIDPEHLQPPPKVGGRMRTDFIRAMGRVEDIFIVLLNMNHVLNRGDMEQLQELASFAEGSGLGPADE
ncbi:purine-binding chemotaxis protein CheW [Magnetovirga frankeli]|uniref:chemotaxis protein CheW n=1 Tax=Magnetovirga frankeli TaxID=947516 RepID=UPI001292EC13|nr:purine-binding chemotaxis protein CheW [gamma proteobacterium SS-5]